MNRLARLTFPALLACLLLPAAAWAADGESVVSGTGTGTIEKPADTMRLQFQIQGQGTTLKEAMDKLKTRQEEVKAGLLKLGADAKAFDAGSLAVNDGSGGDDRSAALQRTMQSRMGRGGGGAASQEAQKITVTSIIKADWTLKSDTPENVLVAASDIKEKIKSSKLLEVKAAPMTEAEQEAAMMAAENGMSPPDQPIYTYVAKITDAEQSKAMADAFAKAKTSATRLAKAAGSDLGVLRSLQGQVTSDPEEAYAMRQYSNNSYYREIMLQRYGSGGADSQEAIGAQPGKVSVQVVVQASFTLK